jgi:small subunit ribosomal protein S27e
MVKIKKGEAKFIRVICPKCKNEQIIYGKSTTKVECLVCSRELAEPTGGKSVIKSKIVEVIV